jgi:hypothetical protein
MFAEFEDNDTSSRIIEAFPSNSMSLELVTVETVEESAMSLEHSVRREG